VGYYDDAAEWLGTAIDMKDCGRYRASIYMSCLAVGCLLKAKVEAIDPGNAKLGEHDSIYLYRVLKEKFESKTDLSKDIVLCRKYHNEARYTNTVKPDVYDEDFVSRFIEIVKRVKTFVDEECVATLDDLINKHKKT
jgi:HEPN domain-containing protein